MIEPTVMIYKEGWWTDTTDGFYSYSIYGVDKRLSILASNRIVLEVIAVDYSNSAYYVSHGAKQVSRVEAFEYLFENHPDIAEWFLFHPEIL